jgi:hypothetical protein
LHPEELLQVHSQLLLLLLLLLLCLMVQTQITADHSCTSSGYMRSRLCLSYISQTNALFSSAAQTCGKQQQLDNFGSCISSGCMQSRLHPEELPQGHSQLLLLCLMAPPLPACHFCCLQARHNARSCTSCVT